jgi:hypothetical protein
MSKQQGRVGLKTYVGISNGNRTTAVGSKRIDNTRAKTTTNPKAHSTSKPKPKQIDKQQSVDNKPDPIKMDPESKVIQLVDELMSKEVQDLSLKLPIHVPLAWRQANPEATKLLEQIARLLSKRGISKGLESKLQEVEEDLAKKQERYFRYRFLCDELKELLLAYTMSEQGKAPTLLLPEAVPLRSNAKVYEAVRRDFYAAELGQWMDDQTAKISNEQQTAHLPASALSGLTPADLANPEILSTDRLRNGKAICTEVEERLQARCLEIIQFHQPLHDVGYSVDVVGFGLEVAARVKRLEEERTRLCHFSHVTLPSLYRQYALTLHQSLQTLRCLVSEYKLERQFKQDDVYVQFLLAHARCIGLKLSVLNYQLQRDTYTPSKVAALKVIRKHLDVAVNEAVVARDRATKRLQQYEALGNDFVALVKQYTQLQRDLEHKQWALEQLSI